MKRLSRVVPALFIVLILTGNIFATGENTKTKRSGKLFDVKIKVWGPTQVQTEAAKKRVERDPGVQNALRGTNHRLIAFDYIENPDGSPPTRYRVIFYDYTNDRTFVAESDFASRQPVTVRRDNFDPGVGNNELEAGFNLIRNDSVFGSLYKENKLNLSGAMPPTTHINGERLVNVGIQSANGDYQIVGIGFKNNRIVRYQNGAPPTSEAAPEGTSCGVTNAGQGSTNSGIAGQYQMTVSQNGNPLWEMLIIRPSSSSGGTQERSGIEVRDVKYKGKSVLKRGHAPILNVKYVDNVCGPYRDWQFAEGFFEAPDKGATYPNGPDGGVMLLAPGQIATTVVESGNDSGNFQGVAVYQQDVGFGNELVLVSEMNASWYRYIMEWRFAADGTIRPRYGFGSISNGCVCHPRTHHVYWRFDFDVVGPNNKVFKVERGRKFLTPILTESAVLRNYQTNRSILIQNGDGDEAYQLTPNLTDGEVANSLGEIFDTYGGGDMWILRFQGKPGSPDEINDPNVGTAANIGAWLNDESLDNQDVVVWYGAHEYRVDATSLTNFDRSGRIIQGVHVVGPDLRPVRW